VLVIGAQKGRAPGVPRGVEAHELEDRLRPYLGSQFPAFEFGRIGVGDEREVLFVIAQPPQDGQPIFPCHKSSTETTVGTTSMTERSTCGEPATPARPGPARCLLS
jgi:hypothetical protein